MKNLRSQFEILNQKVNGKKLVYFDNAATTQKPKRVIEAIKSYYENYNSNIHRGAHTLANKATEKFEEARCTLAKFINATSEKEVIFTSGVTDSINMVAYGYGLKNLKVGDVILVSELEHHSNMVPWFQVAKLTGAVLKKIPVTETLDIDLKAYRELLKENVKIVAINHISNAVGTLNNITTLTKLARDAGAVTIIDGAQASAHIKIDVQEIDCDFYAISGHKMYGPLGTGILYGKEALLKKMDPLKGGGEMVDRVSFENVTYKDAPHKFEAGTPNIAGAIALKTAADFITEIGFEDIEKHEDELINYALKKLSEIKNLQIIGSPEKRKAVISFIIKDVHPYDLGVMLDLNGVAVRTGNHCTEPLMEHLSLSGGTVRISFAIYNTKEEIDTFIDALKSALKKLS